MRWAADAPALLNRISPALVQLLMVDCPHLERAGYGGDSLRVAHDHHPVAGRCGAHNLQEGEPAAEILQLALDRIGGQPVFFDLL